MRYAIMMVGLLALVSFFGNKTLPLDPGSGGGAEIVQVDMDRLENEASPLCGGCHEGAFQFDRLAEIHHLHLVRSGLDQKTIDDALAAFRHAVPSLTDAGDSTPVAVYVGYFEAGDKDELTEAAQRYPDRNHFADFIASQGRHTVLTDPGTKPAHSAALPREIADL